MSKLAYTEVRVLVGGYDLSGRTSKVAISEEFDKAAAEDFLSAAHWNLPGLPTVAFSHEGQADSAASPLGVEDLLVAALGSANALTVCPLGLAVGGPAKFTRAMEFGHEFGGQLGEVYAFRVSGEGNGEMLIPGTIAGQGAKTTTGQGAAYNLGAVTAAQRLYGVLHVTAVSGGSPTLDVIVESDDAQGFGSPVTRLSFTQRATIGAEFKSAAGPFTDTWWRLKWTLGGSTPNFTILGAVGIR